MKGKYIGGIHNTVHEEGKLYLFYPDDSFDIIDLEGEKQMKDHRQIDGLIRQMTECLENAYNRGYKQGIADGNINDGTFAEKVNEAYNNGAKDAWECYSKNLFNFEKEANRQFQEYTKKRESCFDTEIHVGDEVYSETYDEKGVVTKVYDNDIIILSSNSSMIRTPKNKVKKTGKHYDEMEQLLEKMRGE